MGNTSPRMRVVESGTRDVETNVECESWWELSLAQC